MLCRVLFSFAALSAFAAGAGACPCSPQQRLLEVHASIEAARIPSGSWAGAVIGGQWIWIGVGPLGPRVVVQAEDSEVRSAALTHAAYRALQDAWDAMLLDALPTDWELETLEDDVAFFGGSHDLAKFRYGALYCLAPSAPAGRLFDLAELLLDLTTRDPSAQRALMPWIEASAQAAHRVASE